jgi:dynein light chain roadblock-type
MRLWFRRLSFNHSHIPTNLFSKLALKAAGVVRTLDDGDELAFLRVRSKKHEIMIAPDKDYILVVVQTPNEA